MDTWESFFREKSIRRASAASMRSAACWSIGGLALLGLVTGILTALDL